MTFGTKAAGGQNLKNRMNIALGRWAQYQNEASGMPTNIVVDSAACPEGLASEPLFFSEGMSQMNQTQESARIQDHQRPPQPGVFSGPESTEKAEERNAAAGESQGKGFTYRSAQEEQHKERAQANERPEPKSTPAFTDFYEILQISRNADSETIHRVYRIMASRFHPDNPRTGDPERFQLLRTAYQVLSDPSRRAEYDRSYVWAETHTMPVFEVKEFVDGVDGEKNRRLGILSLLYHRRRLSEFRPGISVLDLEQRMGLPREYLNFTLWYLKAKGYVCYEDNSDYGLTPDGVDYLEANSVQNAIIRDLLEAGTKGESGASMGAASTTSENVN